MEKQLGCGRTGAYGPVTARQSVWDADRVEIVGKGVIWWGAKEQRVSLQHVQQRLEDIRYTRQALESADKAARDKHYDRYTLSLIKQDMYSRPLKPRRISSYLGRIRLGDEYGKKCCGDSNEKHGEQFAAYICFDCLRKEETRTAFHKKMREQH